MSQFTTTRSIFGDMNIEAGVIVDLTAGTTGVFDISPRLATGFDPNSDASATRSAPRFAGGSSRNLFIEDYLNSDLPTGWFKQTKRGQWSQEDAPNAQITCTVDEIDGSLVWSDGTDDIMTAPPGSIPVDDRIVCSSLVEGGGVGTSEYTVDLGTATGIVSLNFDAQFVPDTFIVEYDGTEVINSGLRGVDGTYDTPAGPVAVVVDGPGTGTLTFNKTTSTPTTCTVRVVAPFIGTAWEVDLSCPGGGSPPYTQPTRTRTTFTATSTSYGDSLNAGTPFTLDVIYEGGSKTSQLALNSEPLGGLYDLFYVPALPNSVSSITRWDTFSTFGCEIDENGDATISDTEDVVAIRPTEAGFEQYLDPSGSYEATTYGKNLYNNGVDFSVSVNVVTAPPDQLFTYLKLSVSAGSITGVSGPFSSPTLPSNSSGVKILPISYSDGDGNVVQYFEGAVLWK
jgi:hypothetical protein